MGARQRQSITESLNIGNDKNVLSISRCYCIIARFRFIGGTKLANTKSAIKEIRVAAARQERNKSVRSITKTKVRKAESSVATGATEAKDDVRVAISSLDKAAATGIIHANAAARKKSRLVKKLNKSAAAK
jgi:small subunit ribosomal protein S20